MSNFLEILEPIGNDWYQITDNIDHYAMLLKKEPGVRYIPEKSLELHSSHLPLLPDFSCFVPQQSPPEVGKSFSKKWVASLWSWQVEGAEDIRSRKGTLLCDGLGTGKTRTAIYAMDFPAVVVCPNSALQSVWGDELAEAGLRYKILEGRKFDESVFDDKDEIDVWVMPYSIIHRWLPFFSEAGYGPTIKTLVGDEAHELQNRKGKPAQAWHSVNPDRVVILTATPIRNRLKSLWSLLNAVAPNSFGNFWDFRIAYCAATEGEYGLEDGIPSDITIRRLSSRLKQLVIKRSREDVGQIVVPHIREVYTVDTTATERLDTMQGASNREINQLWFNAGAKLTGEQLAMKARMRQAFGLLKAEKGLELIHDCLGDWSRIVLWIWHKKVADFLKDELKDMYDVDTILGSTTKKKRREILKDWKYGDVKPKMPKILIASIGALSSAVSLTACGCSIFVEQDWAPLHMIQAEKRTHRAGQRNDSCESLYLTIGYNTLDEKITKVLVEKTEEDERVFGSDGRGDQMRAILGSAKTDSDAEFMRKILERMT